MFTVTVLTPKGRRQQVKVTPNTTILQILEEVCSKHGFNAEEYDLRHHNKVLDVTSIFRFTSLPNNAQLEMVEAVKPRRESPVTVGVQFEAGERLTAVFSPSESIWNVIISLRPAEEKSTNLVVIYMRQEMYGVENLKMTTLRSLGLTSGRAMFRVIHKSPEELRSQANVSAVLPPRALVKESSEAKVRRDASPSPDLTKKENTKTSSPELAKKRTPPPEGSRKDSKYKPDNYQYRGNFFENFFKDDKARKALLGSRRSSGGSSEPISPPSESFSVEDTVAKNLTGSLVKTETPTKKKAVEEEKHEEESKVIVVGLITVSLKKAVELGERNAVAFNLNSVKPVIFEEEPEDFYELTIHDAQLLLKQAKQLCADLEDAPLMTSAQREFEKDKRVLSLLHQYKKTVLRVKFPDRTVLQGTFSSLEPVSAVEKFVADYLEAPKPKFYLYTTPPKVILKPDTRLIECGCVPCCVLYFGMPPEAPTPAQYLKTEVLKKLSTPSAAALQAYESRGLEKKSRANEAEDASEDAEKRKWPKKVNNSEAGPSGSQDWGNGSKDEENSQFKVPKWFRTNK